MVCQTLTSRRYICNVAIYLDLFGCFGVRSVIVVLVMCLLSDTLLCTGAALTVSSVALVMASRSNKTEVLIV